jgi:phenylalanyl-tRNA synthetase beta chain
MRISYNWLRELLPSAPEPSFAAELLTNTGLEVEAVEAVEAIPGGLVGLVVGEVLEVWKHPSADRLQITRVHVGSGQELQIVCGAKNVAVQQKVAVATEGAVLHPIEGEAFTIRKGKIRGEVSEGMLCAEDEIGLGKGHDGILVLDPTAAVGQPLGSYFNLEQDHAIEIGLTPNRTDAMSHFGVARDLRAAILHRQGADENAAATLHLPDVSGFTIRPKGENLNIAVHLQAPEACQRYVGLTLTGVTVASSPDWLQNRLKTIGLSPINNVVDITNFVMHELGQPLHAFDAAKIAQRNVVVRLASNEEKFVTLDGTERTLDATDLVICDAEKPMCIAGVFGGLHSGISTETTTIFLESAVFDPVFIRRTARRHQLNTDASYRFERGVDADLTVHAIQRAALLIEALAGGCVSSEITDLYPRPMPRPEVIINLKRMAKLLGIELAPAKIQAILTDLDFEIAAASDEAMTVRTPLCRRDVTREADVAEEILRIYGYNSVEIPARLHATIADIPKPNVEALHQKTADLLVARGFNEIMNNSLTKLNYTERYADAALSESQAVKLRNPLSSDLGMMRQSLLFQGLETLVRNINFKQSDLRLFEFGYTYHNREHRTVETPVLALWVTGKKEPESWNNTPSPADFSDLSSAYMAVLNSLGAAEQLVTESYQHPIFGDAIALKRGEKIIVRAGVLASNVLKDADLKQKVYYAEIDWNTLIKVASKSKVSFKPLPRFPAVRRDLSMVFDRSVRFEDIRAAAVKAERKLLQDVGLFDVYEGKNMDPAKKSYAVSFTLLDQESTLTDQKIDAAMQRIQKALEQELGAQLRS